MRNEHETVYGDLAQHIGNLLAERWHGNTAAHKDHPKHVRKTSRTKNHASNEADNGAGNRDTARKTPPRTRTSQTGAASSEEKSAG